MNHETLFLAAVIGFALGLLLRMLQPKQLVFVAAPSSWPYELVLFPTIQLNYWYGYTIRSRHVWSLTIRWICWEFGIGWKIQET